MAELTNDYPTLPDLLRAKNADGTMLQVAPVLMERNPILAHIPWGQCNNGNSHTSSVETSLPTAFLRTYNEVVAASKGSEVQVTDTLCMMQQWSEVDAKLAEHGGDVAGYRALKAKQHISKMSNEAARLIFYGNAATNPRECTGLSIRYSDVTAGNARNLIDMGGTGGDNTSIWFLKFGPESLTGLAAKGSQAGLTREDFGRIAAETHGSQVGNIIKYKEMFGWDFGVALPDWRFSARVASIDVSDLRARAGAEADLIDGMISAYHALETTEGVRIYCNRTLAAQLDRQRRDAVQAGGMLGYVDVDGKVVPAFRGLPMYVCDAILNTEAAV